ncbi:MAG TPA: efflux RND transporter periplasmic adaptor subunit [Pirellulales bacterium]|nr:efflux RND transporter periplasmic adaptor subunit [Pirellulales bacterium]
MSSLKNLTVFTIQKPTAMWAGMLVALAWIGLTLSGCDKFMPGKSASGAPSGPPGMPPPKPPEVFVSLPVLAEVTDYEDFTGRSMAKPTIDIRPRVTGYLDKIYFKEGADVKEGDMLYEIDPRPYQAEVDRAQSNLSQAEAHLKRLNLDLQRANSMLPNRTISQEQYDQVAGDQAEAQAAIGVAQASLDLAKLNLSYTKIKAQISGRLSRTMFDQGNLVKADDTVLTTIVALDPIYATFGVDERLLEKVHTYIAKGMVKTNEKGQVPVLMSLVNEQGFPHPGTVSFIDNHLDTGTGTLEVRGEFPNANRRILPGLYARIRLPLGEPYQAITIPEKALMPDQDKKFVYVVNGENKVEYRQVETGRSEGSQLVILKGVAAGEKVVVSGLQRVRPDMVVEPKIMPSTTTAKN